MRNQNKTKRKYTYYFLEPLDELLVAWIKNEKDGKFDYRELCRKALELRDSILAQNPDLPPALKKFKASTSWASNWTTKKMAPRILPYSKGAVKMLEFEASPSSLAYFDTNDPQVWSIKDICIGDDDEGANFLNRLRASRNCTKLALSNNSFTVEIFEGIVEVLQEKNEVRCLSVFQNSAIRGLGVSLISEKLKHLTCMYLWDCKLQDGDARELAQMLKADDSCLEELILTRNKIGPQGADALGEALLKNRKLKCLSLDGNEIGSGSSAPRFLAALERSPTLERLHLNKNQVGDEVCEALRKNPYAALFDLTLSYNKVTNEGARALASLIETRNCKLRALNLKCNDGIGDDGVIALLDAMRHRGSIHGFRSTIFELNIDIERLTMETILNVRDAENGNSCLVNGKDSFTMHERIPHEPPVPDEALNPLEVFGE